MDCVRSYLFAAALIVFFKGVFAASVTSEALRDTVSREVGDPLFVEMDAARTGIDFESRFENPELWRTLWRQYFIGSIGSGIAIGDVDGDGLPDIFFVGKDSPNALYLNRGDFRFVDVTDAAGLAIPKGIGAGAAMIDIENDGDLDLYVCYVGSPNQLFVNDGAGRFEERAAAVGLAISTGSNAPSFSDYDRDGDLDLYLQCNYLESSEHPAGMPDFLFENRDGVFVDVTNKSGVSGFGQGHAAIWWDFDEDGWPDLYVANDFAPDDRLYRNNKDGSFSDVLKDTFLFAPYSAMGADLGDLNNDGHIDFFVGEMNPRDRAYYLKTVGPLTAKLFSIDQNGISQYMQNAVAVNLGGGQFSDFGNLTGLAATDWTWAPRLLDLDNDGLLDAFFTNGMARAFHDADLGVRVAKATNRRIQVALYQRSPVLEEENLVFRNRGDFQFEEIGEDWGLNLKGVSFAAASADLDGDGDLDLVVGNWSGKPTMFRNSSDVGNRLRVRLVGRESNRFGLGAKVTAKTGEMIQVREHTSTRGYMATDEPLLHFAFSDATEVDELRIDWPSGKTQILRGLATGSSYRIEESETGGVEEQGYPLFVKSEIEMPTGTERWERSKPVDRDQALLPFSEDREGAPILVADLDGDGWEDIVLGGPAGVPLGVLKNEGGQSLHLLESDAFNATKESETVSVALLDYDGDGRNDLLVGNGGIEHERGDAALLDQIFLNKGDMNFSSVEDTLLQKVPLATGDMVEWLGGEGQLSVFVQAGGAISRTYPLAEVNRIYRLGTGGFDVVSDELARALSKLEKVSAMTIADLDGDGSDELVTVEQWGGVDVWSRQDGRVHRKELLSERSGYWSTVDVADFNGDGRLDLLLGNLGLNTKYHVSRDSEYELFFSSDPVASPRLFIDGVKEGDSVYPMETRTLHQMYLPSEMAKTGSYEDFGKMTVEEAFGEEVMAGLYSVSINEARSLLLLQNEEGGFDETALPHLAQAGRIVDSAVFDIDGDEDQDVVLVNESLAPQPWVALAPNRAHLTVLINDGSGLFEAILPGESGLIVDQGQAKRLSVSDLDRDGVAELIVSVSDGPLLVFSVSPGR